MTNYMNEELRNKDVDAMIEILEKARTDETYLFELKGYLQSVLKSREKARNEDYRIMKQAIKSAKKDLEEMFK